jgi:hypothetical protein
VLANVDVRSLQTLLLDGQGQNVLTPDPISDFHPLLKTSSCKMRGRMAIPKAGRLNPNRGKFIEWGPNAAQIGRTCNHFNS